METLPFGDKTPTVRFAELKGRSTPMTSLCRTVTWADATTLSHTVAPEAVANVLLSDVLCSLV